MNEKEINYERKTHNEGKERNLKFHVKKFRIKIKGNIFLSNSHDTIFAKLNNGEI